MGTSIQCGQYSCKTTLEHEGDVYCKRCGGRARAVNEGIVPKKKKRMVSSRRGGAVGTGLSAGQKLSKKELEEKRQADAKAKARRAARRDELLKAQPTGRREGAKGQSGCEGRGDSKKSRHIRSKRQKKVGIHKGKKRKNK